MSRREDIDRFCLILETLRQRLGVRRLSESHGRMCWPHRGVYFFFEKGEFRENGYELRVVRVGTHAVSNGSKTKLWSRLRGHKGTNAGGGNHRGSIFRLHVGSALIKRQGINCATWGKGSSAKKEIRTLEHPVEIKVSQHIWAMPFVWIEADDTPGSESIRVYIERNAIGLLSNIDKVSIDPPSENWLGLDADREVIGRSGLWNMNYAEEKYDPGFIDLFDDLARRM